MSHSLLIDRLGFELNGSAYNPLCYSLDAYSV